MLFISMAICLHYLKHYCQAPKMNREHHILRVIKRCVLDQICQKLQQQEQTQILWKMLNFDLPNVCFSHTSALKLTIESVCLKHTLTGNSKKILLRTVVISKRNTLSLQRTTKAKEQVFLEKQYIFSIRTKTEHKLQAKKPANIFKENKQFLCEIKLQLCFFKCLCNPQPNNQPLHKKVFKSSK